MRLRVFVIASALGLFGCTSGATPGDVSRVEESPQLVGSSLLSVSPSSKGPPSDSAQASPERTTDPVPTGTEALAVTNQIVDIYLDRGWSCPSGAVPAVGGFTVTNPTSDFVAGLVMYKVRYEASGGAVWETGNILLPAVWPGQKLAVELTEMCPDGLESVSPWDSAEVIVEAFNWGLPKAQGEAAPDYGTEVISIAQDPAFPDRRRVDGEVINRGKAGMEARVTAVLFDASDVAVGYKECRARGAGDSWLLKLPPGEVVAVDCRFDRVVGEGERAELVVVPVPLPPSAPSLQ